MWKPYELRTAPHADLIGVYSDLESALDVIRETLKRYGDRDLHIVGLARTSPRGGLWPIAFGADLIELAMREPAAQGRDRRLRELKARSGATARRGMGTRRVARRTAVAV